jgi:hypothetical protein
MGPASAASSTTNAIFITTAAMSSGWPCSDGNQWQPVAISGNQWQLVAISGNQWQSVATSGN